MKLFHPVVSIVSLCCIRRVGAFRPPSSQARSLVSRENCGGTELVPQTVALLDDALAHHEQQTTTSFEIDEKPRNKSVRERGVSFLLAYSIVSNVHGAISLSVAWYLTCCRVQLSPFLAWKEFIKSYGAIYAVLQLLRPLRLAAAVALSHRSAVCLNRIQERLACPQAVAILVQYTIGWMLAVPMGVVGVSVASRVSGVPVFGP